MTSIVPLSILLVDDNIDHAELMKDALLEFNENNIIEHVVDGEQAVIFLQKRVSLGSDGQTDLPDIILLDLRMPRQDGTTTLQIIKNDDKLKHIPVVVISTSITEAEILNCYSLGASGYVSKPLQYEEFSRKIIDVNRYWAQTSKIPKLK